MPSIFFNTLCCELRCHWKSFCSDSAAEVNTTDSFSAHFFCIMFWYNFKRFKHFTFLQKSKIQNFEIAEHFRIRRIQSVSLTNFSFSVDKTNIHIDITLTVWTDWKNFRIYKYLKTTVPPNIQTLIWYKHCSLAAVLQRITLFWQSNWLDQHFHLFSKYIRSVYLIYLPLFGEVSSLSGAKSKCLADFLPNILQNVSSRNLHKRCFSEKC